MDRLEVSNLAIIDRLELELGPGLNAFTGETGAGKSIIVDAIGLLLGARGGTEMVRAGAESLLVTGWWGDRALSRRITEAGRSTARVDGEVVSVRELGEACAREVTVHGQHAAQALLSPAQHRDLLDAALDDRGRAALAEYRRVFRAHAEASARLEALREGERDRARRVDLLGYQLREIEAADPRADEEPDLLVARERLAHAETIAEHASLALAALTEADPNAVGLLVEAGRQLGLAGRHDPGAAQLAQELRDALAAVQAIAGEAHDLAERSAAEPGELDRVEGRLSVLERLKAKYGATLEEVLAFRDEVRADLETLERADTDASELEALRGPLRADLDRCGRALGGARREAAERVAPRLEAVVRSLGMGKARLEFALAPLPEPSPNGLETVEISFSANPGEPLGPLSRVASGGELSRVMLALSSVLGTSTPGVVFDEVDAGVGGAAAVAVAGQLARLAAAHQVLVVTHLAQIAARADRHYRVRKEEADGRTRVVVERLTGDERVLELARMLSGSASSAAVQHARELLAVGRD